MVRLTLHKIPSDRSDKHCTAGYTAPFEMVFRALIRTHHMTSRKKIQAISKAAKKYDCALYIKTGAHPPGVMIAECEQGGTNGLADWVSAVKVEHFCLSPDRGIILQLAPSSYWSTAVCTPAEKIVSSMQYH